MEKFPQSLRSQHFSVTPSYYLMAPSNNCLITLRTVSTFSSLYSEACNCSGFIDSQPNVCAYYDKMLPLKVFTGSHLLSLWYECLSDYGYTYSYEEYPLSPTQLKILNHLTRFYMICEHSTRFQCVTLVVKIT